MRSSAIHMMITISAFISSLCFCLSLVEYPLYSSLCSRRDDGLIQALPNLKGINDTTTAKFFTLLRFSLYGIRQLPFQEKHQMKNISSCHKALRRSVGERQCICFEPLSALRTPILGTKPGHESALQASNPPVRKTAFLTNCGSPH